MASIKRRSDRARRWEVRYRDPDGKQRARLFDRRVDAEQFVVATEHSKLSGTYLDPALGRMTLARFVDEHFRATMVGLEASTRARDESSLRTHILPVFGSRQLVTIDYADCQAWVNELSTRRAPATVVKAAQIMGKVMKAAVRAKRIPHNPMTDVSLPTVTDPDDIYLTPAQVESLAEAMDAVGPQFRALIWLGCYAGPRIGELLALRWSDVDVLHRTVTICRKVIEVSGTGLARAPPRPRPGAGP